MSYENNPKLMAILSMSEIFIIISKDMTVLYNLGIESCEEDRRKFYKNPEYERLEKQYYLEIKRLAEYHLSVWSRYYKRKEERNDSQG